MKSRLFSLGLGLTLVFSPSVASGAPDFWYNDVPENNVYYDAIYTLTEKGTVSGYQDGSFRTMNDITRTEALKIILEGTDHGEEVAEENAGLAPLGDMEDDAWYLPYANYAYEEGYIAGDPYGNLRPNDSINRAEALKILILAANKTNELTESEEDEWFSPYLRYGIDNALLIPDSSGAYYPEATLTRGELCELIYRFENHPYTGEFEFGDATYYGYSSNGSNTASGTRLDAYGKMAAHKTLPFGTNVRITNLKNNQSVVVTIVDRGPYGLGRIIDLTPAAFEELGSLSTGVLDVRLEVLAN